jgi:tetratricopeptide (TPR) repeat protein
MPYVRKRGNQLAIVHGVRDPEAGKVEQRILFTIYSKPEALEILGRRNAVGEGLIRNLLKEQYPGIKFDWKGMRKAIADNLDVLPDTYEYRAARVRKRFGDDFRAFARQVFLAGFGSAPGAEDPLREYRAQLEYLVDVLSFRLRNLSDREDEEERRDPFGWFAALRGPGVPPEAEEHAVGLLEAGKFDRAEAAFRLLVDCFPDFADGHYYLGRVAVEQGRLEEALGHFQRTMEVGRRLFPKRIGKKRYWSDHSTRPYMRGLSNTAVVLSRMQRYDEALALTDRLEKECGEAAGAMDIRATTYLNMGRWRDAAENATRLRGLWPQNSLVAALAQSELGDGEAATASILHAMLNRPQATRIVLGLPLAPDKEVDSFDHNDGVDLVRDLEPFLSGRSRASVRFLRSVLRDPRVVRLQRDIAETNRRWGDPKREDARELGQWLHDARQFDFARERAKELTDLLPVGKRVPARAPNSTLH